jgi:hypothetical protein
VQRTASDTSGGCRGAKGLLPHDLLVIVTVASRAGFRPNRMSVVLGIHTELAAAPRRPQAGPPHGPPQGRGRCNPRPHIGMSGRFRPPGMCRPKDRPCNVDEAVSASIVIMLGGRADL